MLKHLLAIPCFALPLLAVPSHAQLMVTSLLDDCKIEQELMNNGMQSDDITDYVSQASCMMYVQAIYETLQAQGHLCASDTPDRSGRRTLVLLSLMEARGVDYAAPVVAKTLMEAYPCAASSSG